MLSYPQHKCQNYLQAEGAKLQEKSTPREFDLKYFWKKIWKLWLKLELWWFTLKLPKIKDQLILKYKKPTPKLQTAHELKCLKTLRTDST